MLGFLLFMIVMMLLVPAAMLAVGYLWQKRPPKNINGVYGYRTRRSMFSKRTWNFAHKVCSGLWIKFGWWTAAITIVIIVVISIYCSNVDEIGIVGAVVVGLQLIPMSVTIPITERALKQEFGI